MNLFGLSIERRRKSSDLVTRIPSEWGPSGWWKLFGGEFRTGSWQRSEIINRESVIRYGTVWSCITLIASDIAKLWLNLVQKDPSGICTPTVNPAYSPVLRKPNHYQTRVKFVESWQISRLVYGNTYVLKERNHRGGVNQGNVTALYVLDPQRVQVLVAPDGSVFYQLASDNLAGVDAEGLTVPATEIIHDVCVPLYHPLCGVSPIFACGLAATQGLQIQHAATELFENGAQLSGVLTAPATISDTTAKRLQQHWEDNYAGARNAGKIAVLGDGLKFEPMSMTAVDAQLIDQLKWTREEICACFHVPGYMVGVGAAPPYTDIQSINLQYYTQALQNPIENSELLLEEGLEVPADLGIEFDLDALARMDGKTQMAMAKDGVAGGIFSPNEARSRFDLPPVPGGDSPYLQQQNWSLEDLATRSQPGSPLAPAAAAPPSQPAAPAALAVPAVALDLDLIAAAATTAMRKELA